MSDRSTLRNALGQKTHSPLGLLVRHQLAVGETWFRSARRLAVPEPEDRHMTGPPAAVVVGIDLSSGPLEALLVRFPQRTDGVDLRGLAELHRFAAHGRQQVDQRGGVVPARR